MDKPVGVMQVCIVGKINPFPMGEINADVLKRNIEMCEKMMKPLSHKNARNLKEALDKLILEG